MPTSTSSVGGASSSQAIAQPTQAQLQAIANLLSVKTGNVALDNAIAQARPNITRILIAGSCQFDGNDLAAGEAILPAHDRIERPTWHGDFYESNMAETKYGCWNVSSVGDWQLTQPNELRYKVVYSSNKTGKPVTMQAVMKNEYGRWLLFSHKKVY